MKKALLLAIGILLFVQNAPAAQATNPGGQVVIPEGPLVKAKLIGAYATVEPGQTLWIGLEHVIYPGWHTYWVNPGDSGAQTELDWAIEGPAVAGDIAWPLPERIPYLELMNFGFKGTVLMPIPVTIDPSAVPGTEIILKARGRWLVCDQVCIPEEGDVSLSMSVAQKGGAESSFHAERIQEAVAALPGPSPWQAELTANAKRLNIKLLAPELTAAARAQNLKSVEYFPYEEGLIDNAAKQKFKLTKEGLRITIPSGRDVLEFKQTEGVIVFAEDQNGQLVRNGFVISATLVEGASAPALAEINLPMALLFAFLGGIILNIMPCVFPVLFMKAYSFIKQAGEAPRAVRSQGIAYTVGVVMSFATLAVILIALRAGGAQIGWGFQLQSPSIILFLAYLLSLVGFNLSGLFEITGKFAGMGDALTRREGISGSFFTGVLATLVATPCTAPFMGVAIGFALMQSAVMALTIFLALGFGMAFPYLILSLFPKVGNLLPKPGPWMETARKVLAFPMYATAIWLLWVLSLQVSSTAFIGSLTAVAVLALAAIAWGRSQKITGRSRTVHRSIVLIMGAALIVWATLLKADQTAQAQPEEDASIPYSAYTDETLEAHLDANRPVFVNFTAAWCISCLANEKLAFSDKDIQKLFADNEIVYLKADWTNYDPEITKTLAKFGRAGVPLYLFYAPGEREPVILPQILTKRVITKTLLGGRDLP